MENLCKRPVRRVWSSMTYEYDPTKGEINLEPSLTVPDQSMTIDEILRRHVRGLPLTGVKVPEYDAEFDDMDVDPEDYIPDPFKLDKIDRMEYEKEFRERLREIEDKQKKYKEFLKQSQEAKDEKKADSNSNAG